MRRQKTGRRRGRHYGRYSVLLLLFVYIPSAPFLANFFQQSAWLLPAYWCLLCMAALLVLPAVHVPGSLRGQELVQGYAWSGAGIYLALCYGIGIFLKSLAATPYDHSPAGMAGNIVPLLLSLAYREYARAYGTGVLFRLQKHRRKQKYLLLALMAVFFACSDISLKRALLVQDGKALFLFLVQQVLPALLKSSTLIVLAYHGGWKSALVYSAVPELFLRLFPFLPELPWLAQSAVDMAYPVVFAMWIRESLELEDGPGMDPEERKGGVWRSFAGLAAAVAFCWFCVGVFPVYPSVVLTGSMEPGIRPGDVVLIRKISKESEIYGLKEEDVINFSRENFTVTHRIKEVLRDEAGNISFCTQGDNNPAADVDAVIPNNVNGIVVGVVPKVGLGVLLLKGSREAPEGIMTGGGTAES